MGCGSSKTAVAPRVVVIGAGYAGLKLASLLEKETFCTVTLIDEREVLVHEVAALRVCVEPESLPILFVPIADVTRNFIQGKVTSLNRTKNQIVLENGNKIKFDYLILAMGTTGTFPGKLPAVSATQGTKMYQDICFAIRKSHRVLIINGGWIGVTLAGEIKTDYPDKQVIVVHQEANLVSDKLPPEVQEDLQRILYKKDIEVYTNTSIIGLEDINLNQHEKNQKVKTDSGKEFEVDLIVRCTEERNSSSFKTFLSESIDLNGSLKVDPSLKVVGCDNIYAIGDVNDVCEQTIDGRFKQAAYMVEHLNAVLSSSDVVAYKKEPFSMLVPIGRYSGCGVHHDNQVDEDEAMELLSTNLMTKQIWEGLGLTCPLPSFT
ncbi:ferroptosis suppressor protein 1 [Ciona intestinalis]